MKKMIALFIFFLLTSCLQYEQKTPEPIPTCEGLAQSAFVEDEPKQLPNLNVNPLYIEMKNSWTRESQSNYFYYSAFHLYNNVGVYQTDITISDSNHIYLCKKQISLQQYNDLTQTLNQSKMCEAQVYKQNSCSLAMFLPSSIYIVDVNGPLTVNLNPYNLVSKISFCNRNEVQNLQEQISSLFDDLQLETDCTVANYQPY